MLLRYKGGEEKHKKWLRQAERNAFSYISEKYGFEAEVTDSEIERTESLFHMAPLSFAMVTMEHGGREFNVYIDGDRENTDGCDNYQSEEITAALLDTYSSCFPDGSYKLSFYGGKCAGMDEYFSADNEQYNLLYSEYFDGNNLGETVGKGLYCVAEYTDGRSFDNTSLDMDRINGRAAEWVRALMVSYDGEENYGKIPSHDLNVFGDPKYKLYENGMYIQSAYINGFRENVEEHYSFEKKSIDDFYYIVYPSDAQIGVSEERGREVSPSIWEKNAVFYDGLEPVTPFYHCLGDGEIYVYYPKDKLTAEGDLMLGSGEGFPYKTTETEDYYTAELNVQHDEDFAFILGVKEKKK